MKEQVSEWRKNPENVETKHVQFWRNGVMITARMTKAQAQKMVADGHAHVITGQAIQGIGQ